MAREIDKNIADAFSAALDEKTDWQTKVNLRKFVEESFFSIERAVKNKATWEQIAETLQVLVGDSFVVKADTVRQYYGDALKKKEELAREKKRRARKNGTSKKISASKNETTMSKSVADVPTRSIQESARQKTSFNNRPRPNQSTDETPRAESE